MGITWYVFAKSPSKEGPLKNLLDRPFARMKVSTSLDKSFSMINGRWEVCLPVTTFYKLDVRGVGRLLPSWQNRLGLKGEFENKHQFETLRINMQSDDTSVALATLKDKIDGDYVLLPKCGGACGSLRRKSGSLDDSDVFFFLSSGRATLSRDDFFVVASSFHRTAHDEYREIFLEIAAGFCPIVSRTSAEEVVDYHDVVSCTSFGRWIAQENMAMKELLNCDMILTRPRSPLDVPMYDSGWKVCPELLSSEVILNSNDDLVSYCLKLGGSVEVNLQKSKKIFRDIAFVTSRWSLPSLFADGQWSPLRQPKASGSIEESQCMKCAPLKPTVKWTLVSKGKKSLFVPLEDGKEAAVYERALKNRPKPWLLRMAVVDGSSEFKRTTTMTIQVGCNAVSLAQRSLGLLPINSFPRLLMKETLGNEVSSCLFDWRVVLHTDNGVAFPNLLFTSNKRDDEAGQPPRFVRYKLRKEQLRSLTWMLNQESSAKPFFEEEVAEAILPGLNWRIEGRVRRPVLVRGGIIADEVGYGKTAITLGLIDSAEAVNGPPAQPPKDYRSRYIYTNATLVVVPKHLMGQWPCEVEKFLGKSKKVCVIKDLSSLNNLTINDIQRADIVIVSFAVLNNETYFSRLARLAGINPDCFPKGSGGSRHFAAVYSQCLQSLPAQVETIIHNCGEAFNKITDAAKAHGNKDPVVLLDGKKSAYKNDTAAFNVVRANKTVGNADSDPWGLSNTAVKKNYLKMSCPPLEMFFWQRLVVDE
jgi:SNF2-related domain